MGDRRKKDRRAPEEGVIKIDFNDAVLYIVFTIVFLISFVVNVVLGMQVREYKAIIEQYEEEESYYEYEDEDEEEEEDENEATEDDNNIQE